MKQHELKPCAICQRGVMHNGNPVFYRVAIEHMCVDIHAARRQHGLEMMLGNPTLAHAMGTDPDIAQQVDRQDGIVVCLECAIGTPIAALMECAQQKRDES